VGGDGAHSLSSFAWDVIGNYSSSISFYVESTLLLPQVSWLFFLTLFSLFLFNYIFYTTHPLLLLSNCQYYLVILITVSLLRVYCCYFEQPAAAPLAISTKNILPIPISICSREKLYIERVLAAPRLGQGQCLNLNIICGV
jgi:hypothetical protein